MECRKLKPGDRKQPKRFYSYPFGPKYSATRYLFQSIVTIIEIPNLETLHALYLAKVETLTHILEDLEEGVHTKMPPDGMSEVEHLHLCLEFSQILRAVETWLLL